MSAFSREPHVALNPHGYRWMRRANWAAIGVIIWLASYPRSGNTLLRALLKQCFELDSHSLYSDEEFPSPPVREIVGEKPIGTDASRFIQQVRGEGRTIYVKTHEMPGKDQHRAIYIVRDGRSALVSHFHYLRDFLGREISLDALLSGMLPPSWSSHVSAWALSGRPNVLVVRYEDLVLMDVATFDAIATFIGRPLLRSFNLAFADLHKLMPAFFRCGSNDLNIRELTRQQLELFEKHHGAVSVKLGYLHPLARPDI